MTITYFIQGELGGPVKIGRSRREAVGARLIDLQIGNPDHLRIVGIVDGNQERDLHRHLHSYRLRGEWFAPCAAMLAYAPVLLDDARPSPADRLALHAAYTAGWKDAVEHARRTVIEDVERCVNDAFCGAEEPLQSELHEGTRRSLFAPGSRGKGRAAA